MSFSLLVYNRKMKAGRNGASQEAGRIVEEKVVS